ncbi:MAG: nitrile hydratase subunit beta [Parvibaculaceae bacterium]
MNGPHDLGGRMGFGPVGPETNEPVFHAEWERRAMALASCMDSTGEWTLDMSRHANERIPPTEYLAMSYYEIWMAGLVDLMTTAGLVTRDEIAAGRMLTPAKKVKGKLLAEELPAILAQGDPATRPQAGRPRYAHGDKVRTRNMHPEGHTRLPLYLRGHVGEITGLHGTHVFPDSNAHGTGENPQPLYTVKFSAREIWGATRHPRDTISADLWEPYLEPA